MTFVGCGGSVAAAAQGWLTSPGYPTAYPMNARCFWTIHVPQGNAIQFLFVDYDVEPGGCYDSLTVNSNVGTATSILNHTFCCILGKLQLQYICDPS